MLIFGQKQEIWKNSSFNFRVNYNYYGDCQFIEFSDDSGKWNAFQVMVIDNYDEKAKSGAGFSAYLKDFKNNYYVIDYFKSIESMSLQKVTIKSEDDFLFGRFEKKGEPWIFTR